MKDVGGAVLAGSSPPFLGRERCITKRCERKVGLGFKRC